jgi:Arc/MetJ-type ribon-helix-helix transcriptional regulator
MNKPLAWTDEQGDKWSTAIALSDARRLKDQAGVDLLDPKSIEVLFGPDLLGRIEAMGELARPQWEKRELTYDDFADRLIGGPETFADASDALRRALSDFFRRVGREELAVVADRAWEAMAADAQMRIGKAKGDKIGKLLNSGVTRADAEIDRALDAELAKLSSGPSSGSSPGSPG